MCTRLLIITLYYATAYTMYILFFIKTRRLMTDLYYNVCFNKSSNQELRPFR